MVRAELDLTTGDGDDMGRQPIHSPEDDDPVEKRARDRMKERGRGGREREREGERRGSEGDRRGREGEEEEKREGEEREGKERKEGIESTACCCVPSLRLLHC